MTHTSRLYQVVSSEDAKKINEARKVKKMFKDECLEDFEDDYFDDDEEESNCWVCCGCGWVGAERPMGGECPKCMGYVEEEYL